MNKPTWCTKERTCREDGSIKEEYCATGWGGLKNHCIHYNPKINNPTWCTKESICAKNYCKTEQECGRSASCKYYNPQMTFFEAWEKAEEGDKLHRTHDMLVVKNSGCASVVWEGGSNVFQYRLFEKEWTIIPKKKTVTLDIPEVPKDAINIEVTFDTRTDCKHAHLHVPTKITYDI